MPNSSADDLYNAMQRVAYLLIQQPVAGLAGTYLGAVAGHIIEIAEFFRSANAQLDASHITLNVKELSEAAQNSLLKDTTAEGVKGRGIRAIAAVTEYTNVLTQIHPYVGEAGYSKEREGIETAIALLNECRLATIKSVFNKDLFAAWIERCDKMAPPGQIKTLNLDKATKDNAVGVDGRFLINDRAIALLAREPSPGQVVK
jgi:hypothetical protein